MNEQILYFYYMANVKLHFLNRVNDELTRSLNLTADSRNALLIQKGLLKRHCHVKKKKYIFIYLLKESMLTGPEKN